MLIIRNAFHPVRFALAALFLFGIVNTAGAQAERPDASGHPKIKSLSVDISDITLAYPNTVDLDLPDEHTTLFPIRPWWHPWKEHEEDAYLMFGSSKVSVSGTGGAVVLETTDLTHFDSAGDLGYSDQLMSPPMPLKMCDGTHDKEFDENYAGPGSVLQDPTRPPGNLIMIYEAENHCPGGTNQHFFYATVGFAVSSDGGRTWPAPVNSEFGDAATRRPVFKSVIPEPSTTSNSPLGNAIPSGFIDIDQHGEAYLYVTYGNHDGNPADESLRVGRADLGKVDRGFGDNDARFDDDGPIPYDKLQFYKWYNTEFSQPGIGGLDSSVLPSTGCPGKEQMGEITRNDDLGLYMMIFVCNPSSTGNASWYYSTATSLELEDWTDPQPIINSERAVTSPCNLVDHTGSRFDGFYPSFMSPGAAAGHTGLTGRVFFMDGCDTGSRTFGSRAFAITTSEPDHEKPVVVRDRVPERKFQ